MSAANDDDLQPHISRDGPRGSRVALWVPGKFEWTKILAPVPNLPPALAGFRFIHLSDLHVRTDWPRAYDELIDGLERSRADLLLITGDFVDDKNDHRPGLKNLRRLLPRLTARLGTYGILGNHDSDLLAPSLRDLGVTLLDGRRALLESGGAKLELIGLPGVARRDLDTHFIAELPPKSPDTLRIVMSHYPDHFRRIRPLQADFFLAGHTHGGQVCLPGGTPIITHDTMDKRLSKGVYRLAGTWYIVSRGFGFAGPRVRLNCPGEVAEIELTAAQR